MKISGIFHENQYNAAIAEVEIQAEFEFARRLRRGTIPIFFTMFPVGYVYYRYTNHFVEYAVILAIFVLTDLVRFPITSLQKSWYPQRRLAWLRLLDGALISHGVVWACLICYTVYQESLQSPATALVLFVLSGFTSGAMATFSMDRRRAFRHYVLMLGIPSIFLVLSYNFENFVMGMVLASYCGYLVYQTRVHNADFMNLKIQKYLVREETKNLEAKQSILNVEIEERKIVEHALLMAREEALEFTNQKTEFLANVAHEIRTPLNGIIGMTGFLEDFELRTDQAQTAKFIHDCSEDLLKIINDVLDFNAIQTGQLFIDSKSFHLNEILEQAKKLVEPRARVKGLAIHIEFDPQVPKVILGDAGRIKQILINLIGNAVKFTEKGSIRICVSSKRRDSKDPVISAAPSQLPSDNFQQVSNLDHFDFTFKVIDTGIGLSQETLGKLFKSYSQADTSTSRKYGGSGLGLSISKQLAELMGGSMWAESEWGVGSTFFFQIPMKTTEFENSVALKSEFTLRGLGDHTKMGVALQILVAEDNVVNQQVLLKILMKMGFQADLAKDGVEAVDAALRKRYDLILMDIQMPNLSGIEATVKIRSHLPHEQQPRIIAVTASVMEDEVEKVRRAGVDGIIPKPIKPKELSQEIQNCIELKEQQQGVKQKLFAS